MIRFKAAKIDEDLHQILKLQDKNLAAQLSDEETKEEGFVTLKHDFDLLKAMNKPYPHVIAIAGEKLVGYALVMERKWKKHIPLLTPMFDLIDETIYGDHRLGDANYFVMGQVCVSKAYRKKGVFRGLYEKLSATMKNNFDYCITEILTANQRSVNAHLNVGFENIKVYKTKDGREWMIVLFKL